MRTRRIAVVSVAAFLTVTGCGIAAASTLVTYDTTSANFTSFSADDNWHSLYSVDVSGVSTNDILIVTGEGQLTREGEEQKTLLSAILALCSSSDASDCKELFDEGNGINITDDLKIGLPVKLSIKAFSSSPGSAYHYVNLLLQSNGSTFDAASGRLQVLKITP
ncbi:MAG TPA: hypothetical protein VHE09_13030 [Rhizomicrobium sp.]|jgi:hypothetical protein|nr:hypothetical protein [Rhizomicrobium sp.]